MRSREMDRNNRERIKVLAKKGCTLKMETMGAVVGCCHLHEHCTDHEGAARVPASAELRASIHTAFVHWEGVNERWSFLLRNLPCLRSRGRLREISRERKPFKVSMMSILST